MTTDSTAPQIHDDELVFFEEEAAPPPPPAAAPWKVLVVDDEPEVHQVTQLNLGGITFENRPLALLSAYSAREALTLLETHPDVALMLLDVVMESDDAGLKLVHQVREELHNPFVRIVLRTGQPGQAPEREVIVNYDINDYKAKSELTSQKLFTTVLSSLRAYRDIMTIDANRHGLRQIIESSSSLFELQSVERFISGILVQLSAILRLEGDALFCKLVRKPGQNACKDQMQVLAASGRYRHCLGADARTVLEPQVLEHLEAVCRGVPICCSGNRIASLIETGGKLDAVVLLEGNREFNEFDQQLVALFCGNAAVAFDNLFHYQQFHQAQEAAVESLARLAEFKDTDTGEHLKRVERHSRRIAEGLREMGRFADQLDDLFLQQIGLASILHDVGKVGIPESILLKPGRLTPEERRAMERHSAIGGEILRNASARIQGPNYLSLAAEIARSHHERYDGGGYPDGLTGEGIPLSARIVAVADVFDALTSRRPYKEPWPVAKALAVIRDGAGKQFDPRVVAAFSATLEHEGEDGPAEEPPPPA